MPPSALLLGLSPSPSPTLRDSDETPLVILGSSPSQEPVVGNVRPYMRDSGEWSGDELDLELPDMAASTDSEVTPLANFAQLHKIPTLWFTDQPVAVVDQ